MRLEHKDHNRIKAFFHKLHKKAEDILFSALSKIPDKFMPAPFLEWLDHYTDKRIQKLNLQLIQQQWKRGMNMKKTVLSPDFTIGDIHKIREQK